MPANSNPDLFSSRHEVAEDAEEFRKRVMKGEPHGRVDPCFMTGKGCVYSDIINREIADRHARNCCGGFLVTPFRNNLKVFLRNSLRPYFENHYRHPPEGGDPEARPDRDRPTMLLETAEEVRRPGIIICEGICKRVQQSDFIVVDLSISNANVFYELGLAYGMNHKIVLIYQNTGKESSFGNQVATYLNAKSYSYPNLLPIKLNDFAVSKIIWRRNPADNAPLSRNKIVIYEHLAPRAASDESAAGTREDPIRAVLRALADYVQPTTAKTDGAPFDIPLSFSDHLRSDVGTAIGIISDEIENGQPTRKVIKEYFNIVKGLHSPEHIDSTKVDFTQVLKQVDTAYCLIVRTGKDCHPMSYFWLGYAHARGMNVVPITVQNTEDEIPEDLAFDIRAQRHMVFVQNKPERLERELTAGLRDMIYGDFAEWSRKRFWERMLGRPGVVSIFTAALHSDDHDREMIGDWDLRAASELASFFNQHQIRATIETPIYQPEHTFVPTGNERKPIDLREYVTQLEPLLKDKNCILIASPDVNPLTEFVLGYLYNVKPHELFNDTDIIATKPNAIIAIKGVDSKRAHERIPKRVFYKEVPLDKTSLEYSRGFRSHAFEDTDSVMAPFHSQSKPSNERFDTFGHLAILPNPYGTGRYIIVLNGVSGPATFALTHVLTGNAESEFSAYDPDTFDPAAKCEGILNRILQRIPDTGSFKAIQCIIKVAVGANPRQPSADALPYDWRRILSWSLYGEEKDEKGLKPPIHLLQS